MAGKKIKRNFKGVWIPREVWLIPNKELKWLEKLLLVEIDSLDDGEGCWASNTYFAKFFGTTPSRMANLISKLRQDGWIIDRKFNGRKRYISVHQKVKSAFTKKLRQSSQKGEDNNIDIDNKNNNSGKDKSLLAGREVNDLIDLFKSVNPSWERLFAMKPQRKAVDNLVKKHGKEKVERMIKFLPKVVGKPYAPRITTPWQLENKLGELIAFIRQEQDKSKKGGVAVL